MPSLAQKRIDAFILLLLVTVLPFSTTQNTYYVKPTPDTPCHEDPCHTLSEYVSESRQYFTSNTTMVFLPGEHAPQESVTVSNVGRLTFTGNSSTFPTDVTKIICTEATLTFTNILILEIADLDFRSCTIELDTSSAVFKNGSFRNGTSKYGGAIHAHSSITTFDGKTSFEGNRAAEFGGALFAEKSNLTFHGNTTFINNEARGGGGICINQCSLDFSGNASFINNSVENGAVYVENCTVLNAGDNNYFFDSRYAKYCNGGGGVYVDESTVSFGDGSSFIDNSAENGGGVYVWNSTVSFGGNSRFINNSAYYKGGGVSAWDSTVSFGDDNGFIDNSALYYDGGGVYVRGSTVTFGNNSTFINNSAYSDGGGVCVSSESTVNFSNNSTFINSSAQFRGGGICVDESTASFSNNSRFIDNSATHGGGVYVDKSTVSFGDDSKFIDNLAMYYGGGVSAWSESTVTVGDNSRFLNNSADLGGGVYVTFSNVSFGFDSSFIDNSVKGYQGYGGGVYVRWGSNISFGEGSKFIDNSAVLADGIYVDGQSIVGFGEDSRFTNNSAGWWGGGVYVEDSTVSFADSNFTGNSADYFGGCIAAKFSTIINVGGNSQFVNNSARYGGCIFIDTCNLSFSTATIFSGNSAITRNWYSAESGDVYGDAWYGGAILALSSNLTFGGSHDLTNNSAGYGGAIYLTDDSTIYLLPYATVYFESNFAQYRGGALFVDDDNHFTYCIVGSNVETSVLDTDACFIQIHVYETGCTPGEEWNQPDDYIVGPNIELQFQDNVANEAGSVLYGGNLHSCRVCITKFFYTTGEVALSIWTNISSNLMSSDPYHVCICMDNHPECTLNHTTHEIYPGVTFVIAVVAFGQYDGAVPAVIHAYTSEGIILDSLQSTQQSNNTCTNLQYTVRSTRDINDWSEATLTLYADEPCSTLGLPLEIIIAFFPCPLGFSLSTGGSCECDQRLNKFEVHCDINDQSILRKDSVWIGFDEQSDSLSQGMILHPHCPFDYCKPESDSVNFTMNDTDLQCNYNRSGHLCGACQRGYSLAVGSSRCLPCSNKFLALLIAFVCAGLALVIFLFICKVTVAAGTISGLIFYANVVSVNQSIFYPLRETNILTVFIAWLNLDLGIETCFFDGMDAYSLVWLQFVFPIYIWLLVGLITILCNVSTTVVRIIGSTNPIAVLATLFFLSYTKLLRTIIAALSFTILEYPEGETKVVWLYDGNIGYFDKNDGRHIALFLASLLVFLFFFLLYTIFLLFGQWILPRFDLNKLRWLSSANYVRIKSFLDAYHAPYKDRHRYWIGLLLVFRFIMFLFSAVIDIESPQDPHVNLLVIIISTSILGLWAASGGVYKKWYLNVLETSFIFNLTVLSAATYQVKLAGANQDAVFYSSVSVAFSTFIGIITYHVFQRLRDSRAWRNLVRKCNERRRARDHGWEREDAAVDEEMEEMLPQAAPTVTYFEIPTDERRKMRPITPPLSLPNACELPDSSQREDAAGDEEMEEMLPQVTPTVPPIHADKEMSPPAPPPPPPINFIDLREPLDLLTQ